MLIGIEFFMKSLKSMLMMSCDETVQPVQIHGYLVISVIWISGFAFSFSGGNP